jgi:hypothetical protein
VTKSKPAKNEMMVLLTDPVFMSVISMTFVQSHEVKKRTSLVFLDVNNNKCISVLRQTWGG